MPVPTCAWAGGRAGVGRRPALGIQLKSKDSYACFSSSSASGRVFVCGYYLSHLLLYSAASILFVLSLFRSSVTTWACYAAFHVEPCGFTVT